MIDMCYAVFQAFFSYKLRYNNLNANLSRFPTNFSRQLKKLLFSFSFLVFVVIEGKCALCLNMGEG